MCLSCRKIELISRQLYFILNKKNIQLSPVCVPLDIFLLTGSQLTDLQLVQTSLPKAQLVIQT
jgi:hypothetical protein